MTLLTNGGEGGTVGQEVSAANSGGASGDAFSAVTISGTGASSCAWASDQAMHGVRSMKLTHTSGDRIHSPRWNFSGSDVVKSRLYFRLSALPSDFTVIYMVEGVTGNTGKRVYIFADGSIRYDNNAGQAFRSAASKIAADTWYRLEYVIKKGTTTSNGYLHAALYAGESTTPISGTEYESSATNTGTEQYDSALFVRPTNEGVADTGSWALWVDSIAVEHAIADTTFLGPLTPPGGDLQLSGSGTTVFGGTAPSGGSSPVTFVSAGSTGKAAGPSGVATAGLPAGIQAGDLMVFIVGTSRGTASGSATFSASTLWNSFQTRGVNNGSTNTAINWATRIYVPGDPSSYTATLAAGEAANTQIEAFILAFRNVDPSSLTWQGGVSSGSASTSAVAATDVIPPATTIIDNHDGAMALAIVSALGTGGPYAVPSGWTESKQDEASNAAIGNSLSVFHRAYDPGVTTTDAVTVTGTSSTKAGHQLVINAKRPVEGGTGVRVRGATNHSCYWSQSNLPMNKPLGTLTGDLMVATISVDNAGAATDLSAPVGWTDLANGSVTGSGGAGFYKVFYRYAQAGEPDSYTFQTGVDGFGIGSIVSFIDAGIPTSLMYTASGTATGTPTLDGLTGATGAQLLAIALVGTGSNAYRSLTTPTGMTEQTDENAPISGGWNVLGVWTQPLASSAATGTRTTTLLTQASSIAAPASGATGTFAGVQIVVPSGSSGNLTLSGSGSLGFGAASVATGSPLSLSGSGSLGFGTRTPAVNGSLSLSGSGTLSPSGLSTPGSSVTLSGAGSLTFPTTTPRPASSLAFSGAGTAMFFGGGGAGLLQTTGSGSLTFPTRLAGARGSLALSGSGTAVFGPTLMGHRGTLARTGGGSLSLTQAFMSARGSLVRTGLGTMVITAGLISMKLQGWDPTANGGLGAWRPLLVRGWDSENGWRFIASYRQKDGNWS